MYNIRVYYKKNTQSELLYVLFVFNTTLNNRRQVYTKFKKQITTEYKNKIK